MEKILIPTDFSENSENTIHYGARLARDLHKGIELIHAIDLYEYDMNYSLSDDVMAPHISTDMLQFRRETAETSLEKMKNNLKRQYPDLPLVDYKIQDGIVPKIIAERAKAKDIQMILLTGRGEDDLISKLISDSNYRIVEEADCPVWLIPPKADYKSLKKIIYATDYQEEDIYTLQRLSKLAEIYRSEIYALHIVKNEDFNVKVKQTGFQNLVREKVGYNPIHVMVTMSYNNFEKIDEVAHEIGADLIVTLKENKGFLQKIFSPDVTRKLILHTDLPVLVYHESNNIEK